MTLPVVPSGTADTSAGCAGAGMEESPDVSSSKCFCPRARWMVLETDFEVPENEMMDCQICVVERLMICRTVN
ncbi:hypothetical protein [Oleidesulfovibrio sp.]|uniref:hypothetical protein n=1 Tax=Oleidesulfovibrio sp. TaxID=2909707 RepID=UPI003A85C9AA